MHSLRSVAKRIWLERSASRAFGVSQPAVSRWVRKGVLPEKQVMRLQLGLVAAPKPVDARIRRKQLQVEAARRWAEKG
jgi:hypothetical protein